MYTNIPFSMDFNIQAKNCSFIFLCNNLKVTANLCCLITYLLLCIFSAPSKMKVLLTFLLPLQGFTVHSQQRHGSLSQLSQSSDMYLCFTPLSSFSASHLALFELSKSNSESQYDDRKFCCFLYFAIIYILFRSTLSQMVDKYVCSIRGQLTKVLRFKVFIHNLMS